MFALFVPWLMTAALYCTVPSNNPCMLCGLTWINLPMNLCGGGTGGLSICGGGGAFRGSAGGIRGILGGMGTLGAKTGGGGGLTTG